MTRKRKIGNDRNPRKRMAILPLLAVPFLILAACNAAAATGRPEGKLAVAGSLPAIAGAVVGDTSTPTLASMQDQLQDLYERVSPSVVSIQVSPKAPVPAAPPQSPSAQLPPDEAPSRQAQLLRNSLGSGFVWDSSGHIVTNNHVVAGAERITVTFSDGYMAPATLVGNDHDADLAVVKVEVSGDRLKPIEVADSTHVRVGQIGIVIGNPYGLQGSMSMGIVSAIGRSLGAASSAPASGKFTIPGVIQTDASINPGNSGGVLVDVQGRIIGVTSAIIFNQGVNSGIGFAIPSVMVKKIAGEIIKTGSYQHPWLGASLATLSPGMATSMGLSENQRGALLTDVVPDGPAAKSGLRGGEQHVAADNMNAKVGGDLVVAVNGVPVRDLNDLIGYIAQQTDAGQTITLAILRSGKETAVKVVLEARPG